MASKDLYSKFVEVHSLEFYKNKKNRMHCDETRECKKTKVNLTFEVEQPDNLNDGFLETGFDSEKASNTISPLRTSNLSQQWSESVNIWPTDTENAQKSLLMGQRENEDTICDRKGQSEAKSLFTLQDFELNTMPAAFQNPCEIEHCDFDQGDNVEFHAYLGYSEEASEGYAVALDDDFLEDQKLVSVDSFSVFCREADLRAHSSELELSVNDSKQVPDANTIARMSSTELTSTIQMHARALASLLRENNERMKLHQSVASAGNADADVAGDHAEFVAGSFRNKDFCPHPTRSTRDTSSNQLNTTSEISFLS